MVFGYARVSTSDQHIRSYMELLESAGCERVCSDVASGVREDRKGLNDMLERLSEGDIVIVYKNDRIFRSVKNMVGLIDIFNEKKVQFKSLTEPEFDTTTANGKILLQIFAAVAEFERNLIRDRTKSGLEMQGNGKWPLAGPKAPKGPPSRNTCTPSTFSTVTGIQLMRHAG